MLRQLNELEGYAIEASDGAVGQVTDCLFDDEAWVVRYLVVYTGSWLSNRTVLISPIAIGKPAWSDKTLRVPMTMEQVKNSPDVDTKKPVSRQYEFEYFGYYGYYPYYWGTSALWGGSDFPRELRSGVSDAKEGVEPHTVAADRARVAREVEQHRDDDPHLRSANAVMRYHINASDGGIGHVQGLLLDEDTWAIRYLIVDTGNWWLGHKVLIAPQWIQGLSWSERTVAINLTREAIKGSPPYDSAGSLQRHEEASLHDHYQRVGYWADHVRLQNPEFHVVASAPQDAIDRHT
jgi:sporulation protein YlmC with PRC-barrel domain